MIIRDWTLLKGFKKSHLAVALGACLLAPSAPVHALGMGEIEVRSALNEPLDAEIKLLSAEADELSGLDVTLAPEAAFNRMGIDMLPILGQLEFELVRKGKGAPYIKVISDQPIREPFLDFILKVSWANGQMLREYTLLLDPPVFEEGESAPVSVAAPVTESTAISRVQTTEPAAPVTKRQMVAPSGSYLVKRNDTLWDVAMQMRSGNDSVTVQQMMIGLLKDNPEAFGRDNINNLRAGYILRAPSDETLRAISASSAAAEANRQYDQWLAGKRGTGGTAVARAATPATDAVSPRAKATSGTSSASENARLQLVSPDDAKDVSGVGSSVEGGEGSARQLAIAMETVEATRQENADLKNRVGELEKQLESMQRLLTLKSDTMGALQAGIEQEKEQQAAAAASAPEGAETEATVADMAAGDETEALVAGAAVQSAQDEQQAQPGGAEEQAEPKPAVAAKPESDATAAEADEPFAILPPELIDEIMADPRYLALGVGLPILLVLIVIATIRRRREQQELDEFEMFAPSAIPSDDQIDIGDDIVARQATGLDAGESFGETIDEAPMVAPVDYSTNDIGSIQAEESEIDPIAEADVYLAYRRYEQAEALLKEAIRADEDNQALKLKLLEIYFTTKDKDSFEAQAEALYAALAGQDEEMWLQAVEMGREICPDHPLFSDSGVMPVADGGEAAAVDYSPSHESEFDLDIGGDSDSLTMDTGTYVTTAEDEATAAAFDSISDMAAESTRMDDEATAAAFDSISDMELNLDMGADIDAQPSGEMSFDSVDDLSSTEALASSESEFDLSDNDLGSGFEMDLDLDGDVVQSLSKESMLAAENVDDDSDFLSGLDLGGDVEQSDDFSDSLDLSGTDFGGEVQFGENVAESSDQLDDFQLDDLSSGFGGLDELEQEADDLIGGLDISSSSEGQELELESAMSSFDTQDISSELDDDTASLSALDESSDTSDYNLDQLTLDEDEFEKEEDIFDSSDDVVGTKLDLAKAYIDMGDQVGARSILSEVTKEGDDDQRQEAEQLMRQIS